MRTIMNKKAFILVEIIVSVVILSIVGIALLKVNANQKKLYSITSSKKEFSRNISIITNNHSSDLHNKDINLYDFVKDRYQLTNEELIKILKEKKVSYLQKDKSIFTLEEGEKTINILIDEIKISDKKSSSKYITVKM